MMALLAERIRWVPLLTLALALLMALSATPSCHPVIAECENEETTCEGAVARTCDSYEGGDDETHHQWRAQTCASAAQCKVADRGGGQLMAFCTLSTEKAPQCNEEQTSLACDPKDKTMVDDCSFGYVVDRRQCPQDGLDKTCFWTNNCK